MAEDITLFPRMSLSTMQHHTNALAAAAADYIQIGTTVQYKMATAFAEAIFPFNNILIFSSLMDRFHIPETRLFTF
jgi:hypothetical protein